MLAETLQLLVNLSALQCQFVKGEAFGEKCERLLESLIVEERTAASLTRLEYHLLLRTQLYGDLMEIHLKMGHPEHAAKDLEQEEKSSLEFGALERPNFTLIRLGTDRALFALAIQDFEGCRARCDEVMNLGTELDPGERQLVCISKAVALSQEGLTNRAEAAEAAKLFLEVLGIPGLDPLNRAQALEGLVDLDLRDGDLVSAQQRLATLLQLFDTNSAGVEPCHFDELHDRAVALRTRLSLQRKDSPEDLRACRAELEKRYAAMFARYAQLPVLKGGIGFLHWANPRQLMSERIRVEIALDGSTLGAEYALDIVLRAQSLGTMSRSLGAPTVGLKDIREQLLSPGIGLLVYLPSLDDSHLFVVDQDHVRDVVLASRHDLVNAARDFGRTIHSPPPSPDAKDDATTREHAIQSLGDALRKLVLPDEALELVREWHGFYVSGTDLIGNPALECLPLPSGRDLGTEFALSQLPSVPVGVWLAQRATREPLLERAIPKLVVLAGPRHSIAVQNQWPALTPFDFGEEDMHALEQSFQPGEARFLRRDDATRAKLTAALSLSPDVLEVFTHGVYSVGRERPAGLVIGEDDDAHDGVLWSEDVEQDLHSPPIVALFACGSALGPSRMGDDSAAQLANAFLKQGAYGVILSRGSLMYGAMMEMARSFNEEIRIHGRSVAEALRRARMKLAKDPRWHDPYYSGQVSVVGIGLRSPAAERAGLQTGTPVHEGASAPSCWWILSGVALGALLAFLWVRKQSADASRPDH